MREVTMDGKPPVGSFQWQKQRIATLEAQCAAMREALESIRERGDPTQGLWCGACTASEHDEHDDWCPATKALATDAGKAVLDEKQGLAEALTKAETRAEKAERERDELRVERQASSGWKHGWVPVTDETQRTAAMAKAWALEEAAKAAELHGNAFAGHYEQAQLVRRTSESIATAIRALKDSNG